MPRSRARAAIRRTFQLFGLFLVIHFLLPLLGGLRSSVHVLDTANPWLVGLAVVLQAASLVAYGQCARVLLPTDSRIGLLPVLRVQLAMLALTHVVPGGAAASTPVGYRLFRRSGVPPGDAGFVLGLQGIGSAVVLNVMFTLVLIGSIPFRGFKVTYVFALVVGTVLVLLLVGALLSAWTRAGWTRAIERGIARRVSPARRASLAAVRDDLAENLARLRGDRWMGPKAAGWAAAQWALDCASLWVFLVAFGAFPAPDAVFIAFGLSNLLAFVPITPGGLGVFEAVLTSSLVGFGLAKATVVVSVLAYRLAEFWAPIPVGGLGYLTFRWWETEPPPDQETAGSQHPSPGRGRSSDGN